jgi:hypothetical protein
MDWCFRWNLALLFAFERQCIATNCAVVVLPYIRRKHRIILHSYQTWSSLDRVFVKSIHRLAVQLRSNPENIILISFKKNLKNIILDKIKKN